MLTDPLILTIILECLVLLILMEKDIVFYVYWIAITTITNVPANLYMTYFFHGRRFEYWISIAVIEALVVLVEYLLCYAYTKNKVKSIIYSIICNSASYFIGRYIVRSFLLGGF